MPVTVECDNCFRVYNNVPDAAVGKAIKCKDCGERVVVQRPGAAPQEPVELPPLPTSPNAQRAAGNGATRGKRPSSKLAAKGGSSETSTGSNIKYIAIAVLGFVISVGGMVLKKGGRVARAINRNNAEQAEPAQPTIPQLLAEIRDLNGEIAEQRSLLETLPADSTEALDIKIDLSALTNRRRNIALSSKELPGGDTEEASEELLTLRRDAFAKTLDSRKSSRSMGLIVAIMTVDEYRVFEAGFRSLPPGALGQLAMEIPMGVALNDNEFVKKRQDIFSEILKRYPRTAPVGGALSRLTLSDYRDFERLSVAAEEEMAKLSIARAFDLNTSQITFDDSGYHFPPQVHDAITKSFRVAFDDYVRNGANTEAPADTTSPAGVLKPIIAPRSNVSRSNISQPNATRSDMALTPSKVVVVGDSLPAWTPLAPTTDSTIVPWDVSIKQPVELRDSARDFLPTQPIGPFVFGFRTYPRNYGPIDVFDVRSGEKVAAIDTDLPRGDPKLSPDAKTLVILPSIESGDGKSHNVFNVSTGDTTLTIRSPQCLVVEWSAVIRHDRLVALESRKDGDDNGANNYVLVVYDLESGEPLHELGVDRRLKGDGICVSSDGHYVAAVTKRNDATDLFVFDVENGRAIAKTKLQLSSGSEQPTVAFSSDGQQLAVLEAGTKKQTLLKILDTATGETKHTITLPGSPARYESGLSLSGKGSLQWFPDRTAVLVGKTAVIDLERGRELLRCQQNDSGMFSASLESGLRIPANDGVLELSEPSSVKSTAIGFTPVDFDHLRKLSDTSPDDALLQIGQEISVEVVLGEANSKEQVSQDTFEQALEEAAETLGFRVVDEAAIILRLTKIDGIGPESIGKLDVSAFVAAASGQNYEIAWVRRSGSKLLWKWPLPVFPTDISLSKSVVTGSSRNPFLLLANGVGNAVRSVGIPTMISNDGKSGLPAVGRVSEKISARR